MNEDAGPRSGQRQLWLVPSEGTARHQAVADVAVDAPMVRVLAFAVPDDLAEQVRPGALLKVPYGRGQRTATGLCLGVSQRPLDQTLRPVLDASPGVDWLSPTLVELGLWVSEYYVASPWKTFRAIVPSVVRAPPGRKVVCLRVTGGPVGGKLTQKQAAVLAALRDGELSRAELLDRVSATAATVRTLVRRGLVEQVVRRSTGASPAPEAAPLASTVEDAFVLTPGQAAAQEAIQRALDSGPAFRALVLLGVPGSGKTEVYVRAIREVLRCGRQAILLIPEIALATQVVDRLVRRFARVAVLHSQLTSSRRRDTLGGIASGRVEVVIGTRNAVFAPCPRLGLIVVDEEQESSFKNLAAPYYHARDVAIKRAQLEGVPVVLGSATPSLETWHNVQQRGHYALIRLENRVPGAQLPRCHCVALDADEREPGEVLLSRALRDELQATLDAGQQAILLHNRRGYAVFLRCPDCGLVVRCERCGSHLVLHQADNAMKCHRCGASQPVPARCLDDSCNGRLQRSGMAIQRLEEELRRLLPQARLLRLDSDTMRRRDDYRDALQRFESGEADILLGTQMVAKGLDFPRVRLVGVVDADAALALPDFRAAERVFQLIVQVVGRAGRREGESLALVQTGARPADVLQHALRMAYEKFAAVEIGRRKRWGFPPATRLVRIICADARPRRAREAAERLSLGLRERAARTHAGIQVDPPQECIIRRQRDLLRHEVLVRGTRTARVQPLLLEMLHDRDLRPRVQRLTIDVDPMDVF